MSAPPIHRRRLPRRGALIPLALLLALASVSACAPGASGAGSSSPRPQADPRVGLRAGLMDAGQAAWNLRLVSATPSPEHFIGETNSDLAFSGPYAIQGNYNGFQVWDISDPRSPALKLAHLCPASQSDVSVYRNLLFVSGEGMGGRVDCGTQGVPDSVSSDRLRGIRVFDISDIAHPKYLANVQTCRGSHTHTVVEDPKDQENVYIYVSGSAPVRSPSELPGCSGLDPEEDPQTARFRIEVIRVPIAHPERAAIVSSPRIFNDLAPPPSHGESPEDEARMAKAIAAARAAGGFIAEVNGRQFVLPSGFVKVMLDSVVKARGASGAPTGADSAALRTALPDIVARIVGRNSGRPRGPDQCHDITVYPAIGLAGGACGGYGLLLDIRDVAHPRRIDAVADSNFSYWHSATFNNDGTKVLFSDEWGGGGAPRCRASDRPEWGADAIFTLEGGRMAFQSYYKLPAPQTPEENCVAHNGSLIPIPGRDVMVQGWYQGGISVFDWTDAAHPKEIAYFDRGPVDATKMEMGGSWSAYWYNGVIVSSEIARGLDLFELTPSEFLSRNEIDASRTVRLDYLNVQGQPQFVWPASFALARAYLDQLARSNGLAAARIAEVRGALAKAEKASGQGRRQALTALATDLRRDAGTAGDRARVGTLAVTVEELAGTGS